MFDVRQIVENNNRTFYDFASNTQLSVLPRFLGLWVAAVLLALTFPRQTAEFLNGVLTAQAILVGFSFNVLFFLLSNSADQSRDNVSIERNLTQKKVERIGGELFHNISYYNLITISSVVLALIFMSASIDETFLKYFSSYQWYKSIIENKIVDELLPYLKGIFRITTSSALYFLILESLFTFYRTVFRVSYYFEKRLELRKR